MTSRQVSKIASELDGEVRSMQGMKQHRDNLVAGRIDQDGLEDLALIRFYPKRLGREAPVIELAPAVDPAVVAAQEADDETYRAGQREKYHKLYGFGEQDEDALEMLVGMLSEHRKLQRELKRERMQYRERVELLKEMRQLSSEFVDLQKSLGIDRATRSEQERTSDPMTTLREQIKSGNRKTLELTERTAEYASDATTLEELRALMKHALTIGAYDLIDPWFAAYDRLHGREVSPELTALSQHNDLSRFAP